MFGLGAQELILILIIVMVLFGARRIPEIARGLGKSMTEFKKGAKEGEAEASDTADEARDESEAGKNPP